MAHFEKSEMQSWLESSKLAPQFVDIDEDLATQIGTMIKSRLAPIYTVANWTTANNTPKLVRTIIAMHYVAWIYDKTFSVDSDETNDYAALLRSTADANILALISGAVILEEDPLTTSDTGTPVFFPNDTSSANPPSEDFPSDGGPAFMMGTVF